MHTETVTSDLYKRIDTHIKLDKLGWWQGLDTVHYPDEVKTVGRNHCQAWNLPLYLFRLSLVFALQFVCLWMFQLPSRGCNGFRSAIEFAWLVYNSHTLFSDVAIHEPKFRIAWICGWVERLKIDVKFYTKKKNMSAALFTFCADYVSLKIIVSVF